MAFQFNGLSGQEVTISGEVATQNSITKPGTGQTPIVATASLGTSATTIYTASAGKTFYLTGIVASSGTNNRSFELKDTDGLTTIIGLMTEGTSQQVNIPSKPYADDEPVKALTSQAGGSFFSIMGYEE